WTETKKIGDVVVTVFALTAQDNTAISITLQNTGSKAATITLGSTDLTANKRSKRRRTVDLPPGATRNKNLYGHLTHVFMLEVCQLDGTCVQIGPINRQFGGGMPRSRGPVLLPAPPVAP